MLDVLVNIMSRTTHEDVTGLDALDASGHPARDASHFRTIIAAASGVSAAEETLRDAVRAARTAGESWTVIGAALGVSKQAAQQRFGRAAA